MRALTHASLRRAAEHYLGRHPASEQRLGVVLRRKVEAHARKHGIPVPDEAAGWIEAIVASLVREGLVDDRRLAASRVRSMRNAGKSSRAVRASLRQKGVASPLVEQVLRAGVDDPGGVSLESLDEAAALVLARKKKLGPFRAESTRVEMRAKDLAVLARAGFSFAIARRIVDRDEP